MKVGIIMGSKSDMEVMKGAMQILKEFQIEVEMTVVSAHRTPERLYHFASHAEDNGFDVIIAGAGGAAHLPGMVASITHLPVIGVPILSRNSLQGWDSLLSIVQMPNGVPVATVAVDAAQNAGILAVQMLSINNNTLKEKLKHYKKKLQEKVLTQAQEVELLNE